MNLWNSTRIAYVEDQKGVRESVCDFLDSKGNTHVIYSTDNGNDLINYLHETVPLPNICIIDISMPKMDGLTLLKKIRKTFGKSLPCLIYTMHHNEQTIMKALHLGANGYLSKQYGYEELYQAVVAIATTGFAYTKDADVNMFESIMNHKTKVFNLSEKERQFIKHAGSDLSYPEIARLMNISAKTVENYRSKCFKKLNVSTRVGLTLEAIKLGIINI
ncbi:MAG: response regulator transcription factor [Candidatus Pedobacter colombiensis]|uniref:Response regulator transcription factor n=1 Tax=Candidatus Pedobacter colombiensis TaxID=3121371 RepID=A0AAJ5WB47_9SPHI|nr:response regulator transcription factor [Pedobacter sp.]WEK21351.1 MAG: response regulator transcription factor [Pedobacter sp.]